MGERPFPTYPHDPTTPVADAEIAGTLTLEGGCLFVTGREGAKHVVVLPDIAVWDPVTGSVDLGSHSASVGDHVAWGGAYREADQNSDAPAGCPTTGEWAVVQAFGG
ncbi:MAG: hypothetical protein Q4F65_00600 [Propionibacteriaceae bacterium]|nr:hypothetical protein [Propionibacteriaceae bacterium]